MPQQVCLRCCEKVEFACEFFEDCLSVQQRFPTLTSQTTATAMNQRNDARIEDENKDKDEIEMGADKENTAPIVKGAKNLKRTRRSRSRQGTIKKQKKDTPLKEQVQSIVSTNALDQKESNGPTKEATVSRPFCKSQEMTVKPEDIDSEEASSQSRKSVIKTLSRSHGMVWIPNENCQSSDSSACRETEVEASCASTTSGDQMGLKVNGEFDSRLPQTNDGNSNGSSPSASCVSKSNKSETRTNNISRLMTDEQKNLVDTGYRVNLGLMNSEVQNKMTVLSKESIKCNICGVNYSRPDKCKIHIMSHLKIKPYECAICNYTTVSVSNVRTHIRRIHIKLKPYACDQCKKSYGSLVFLQEHMNSHTGNRPFKCNICHLAYMSRQGLKCHYKTHKLNKDVKCEICPKMFKSTTKMRTHMYIHNKENMIQCTICKSYLLNQVTFDAHMKRSHSRKYYCDICNKEILSRKELYSHKNVHMEAKYKCTKCSKYYKSKHVLNEHMLKHEGIRKYKCNDCKKTFAQKSHLSAHSATHSNIRFSCMGCEKQFNRRDNMKMHTKRCQLFLQKSDTFVPDTQKQIDQHTNGKQRDKITIGETYDYYESTRC